MTTPRPLRTRLVAAAALTLAATLLAGCGTAVTGAPAAPQSDAAVSLQNCGRDVQFTGTPKSVVGLHPAQTELLLRLGLADRLVGQAQTAKRDLPADIAHLAANVPVIGASKPPSREDLLAVSPDFVYSPTTYEFTAEQGFASIDQLTAAGANAYVATGGCFDRRMTGEVPDLFTDLDNLGAIFGVTDEANSLKATSQADLDAVAAAVAGHNRLRVAQVFVDGTTLQAIGAGVEYDILKRAGADNVYRPEQPAFASFFAATITPESLAAEQPEALVFAVTDAAHEAATRAYLTSTFPDMPAVRDGRLIAVSSSDMFPGTLGNISVVRQIATALYPSAF